MKELQKILRSRKHGGSEHESRTQSLHTAVTATQALSKLALVANMKKK